MVGTGWKCECSSHRQTRERCRYHPKERKVFREYLNAVESETKHEEYIQNIHTSDLIVGKRVRLVHLHEAAKTKKEDIEHVGILLLHGAKFHSDLDAVSSDSSNRDLACRLTSLKTLSVHEVAIGVDKIALDIRLHRGSDMLEG